MLCWSQVQPYNVLMLLPFGAKSHKNIFDAISDELIERGHTVTMFTIVNETSHRKGLTHIVIERAEEHFKDFNFTFFNNTMDNLATLQLMSDLIGLVRIMVYDQPELRKLWEDPTSPKFDVMLVDTIFNEFVLPIAHQLKMPVIYVSPSVVFPGISYSLNIPYPYSYLSSGLSKIYHQSNLWQRARNALENVVFLLWRNWYLFSKHDQFTKTVFPNSPSIAELERNVSFVMSHTHPALNPSAPSMPYTAQIACIHCRPAKKLPQDLLSYFDNSGDAGVIYFSLGSATKGDSMPYEMRNKVIKAFSQLPQRILWKYEKPIEGLPKNIKLTDWAPQQDILAHPKLRLFITHGGGLSTLEAAYHGCPVLGFPLSADQLGNMAQCEHIGFGLQLAWKTFTVDDLVHNIKLIINDKRFKEKAKSLSGLLQDQPIHPKKTAAYWIEYVIRHKGAPHLKSGADCLNFFQYFLLDVIAIVFLTLIIVGTVSYFIIRAICKCLCGRTAVKTDTSKSQNKKQSKKKQKAN